jgi:hypothetical protein
MSNPKRYPETMKFHLTVFGMSLLREQPVARIAGLNNRLNHEHAA